jgi:prepilin-type N-terminal cleavage/methylation domain-containing protein
MSNRRGYTLIELMIVIVIVGILVRIAVPKVQTMRNRGTAAKIVGAMTVVRHAAYQYSEANGNWPTSSSSGNIPAGLGTYLPRGFSFEQADVELAWQTATTGSGSNRRTYGVVQAYPTTDAVCPILYAVLGGSRNANASSNCNGNPRVEFYVDR